tara:strand:+ start:5898 stop:6128 length:231 start_codon:yes stop_codon:yes gene_type:complete
MGAVGVIHDTPHTTHPSVVIAHARIDASSIHHPTTPVSRVVSIFQSLDRWVTSTASMRFSRHTAPPLAPRRRGLDA